MVKIMVIEGDFRSLSLELFCSRSLKFGRNSCHDHYRKLCQILGQ